MIFYGLFYENERFFFMDFYVFFKCFCFFDVFLKKHIKKTLKKHKKTIKNP